MKETSLLYELDTWGDGIQNNFYTKKLYVASQTFVQLELQARVVLSKDALIRRQRAFNVKGLRVSEKFLIFVDGKLSFWNVFEVWPVGCIRVMRSI